MSGTPLNRKIVYSESSALKDILAWSQDRPNWQRDALRRRILNGQFTDQDKLALLEICLNDQVVFEPLEAKHIAPEKVEGQPVSVKSVANPQGINALAGNQSIEFSDQGLTIVYGDNGSGKSGYVRVLKDACRSRDERFEILGDINAGSEQVQNATIGYKVGEGENSLHWQPGTEDTSELSAISIFDSGSARTHLGKEHNVAYTPFPMLVLKDMADMCDSLKAAIEQKIDRLEEQTPAIVRQPSLDKETPAGAFLWSLSATSKTSTLDVLSGVTEEDTKRGQQLAEGLSGDPLKVAARLRSQQTRLKKLSNQAEQFWTEVSEASFQKVSALRAEFETKSSLAKAASEKLFAQSPLPDIGGDLWRGLWEAARRYSDDVAYPATKFPQPGSDELCVLCQQPLGDEAKTRRLTFEEFVKGTTKADEGKAKQALSIALQQAEQIAVDDATRDQVSQLLGEELTEPELAAELLDVIRSCQERMAELQLDSQAKTAQLPFPKNKLDGLNLSLEKRALELENSAKEEERLKLQAEKKALDDKAALASLRADVAAEIERRKEVAELKKKLKTTNKRTVTTKNQELSDKLVTDALRGRFAREIEKLKVLPMPIELRKERDRSAQSYFRVSLVGKPGLPVGNILSEGEHRCVALAAFLAELVTANDYSGIVFDDPMSSLDHLYRANVAQRLVEEAAHRQVIVFTHDLTFLFELTSKAEALGQELMYQTVSRKSSGPGYIEDDLPFKAQSAGAMENSLRSLLKGYKGNFEDKPQGERELIAKGVIAQLRIAWEQGVAEFIKPVLNRFDRSVKPNSLFKLLVLNDQDVSAVSSARTRLSEDVHAAPETLNPAEVARDELVQELDIFRDWLTNLKERQKKAKS